MNWTNTLNSDLKRGFFQFEVTIAKNGFIFGEYDVITDKYAATIAKDPDELETAIRGWLDARIADLKSLAAKKATEAANG